MAKRPIRVNQKKNKLPFILGILAGLVVVMTVGGFSVGATLEQTDSFCASCHTQPEATFFQRSTANAPVDLASFHTTKTTHCIDCHSDSGVTGRVGAEISGAFNAMHFFTNTATQPSKLYAPFSDANCLKCHEAAITASANRNNHFHVFLSRWQATDPNAGRCTSCHAAHTHDGASDNGFMVDARTQPVCDACHQVLAQGGG
jgi:predicted CXXCH cytochrome family protein